MVAADLASLRSAVTADEFSDLLGGRGLAPIMAEMLGAIGEAGALVDLSFAVTAVLAYEEQDAGSRMLLAALTTNATEAVLQGAAAGSTADGRPLFEAGAGQVATLLADGTLIVASAAAIDDVLAVVADGLAPTGPLGVYVEALELGRPLEFVLGLPGLVDSSLSPATVRGSAALSGALEVADGNVSGQLALHSDGAEA